MPAKLLSCSFLTLLLPCFSLCHSFLLFVSLSNTSCSSFCYFVLSIFLSSPTLLHISPHLSFSSALLSSPQSLSLLPAESCIVAVGGCEFEERTTVRLRQPSRLSAKQSCCFYKSPKTSVFTGSASLCGSSLTSFIPQQTLSDFD